LPPDLFAGGRYHRRLIPSQINKRQKDIPPTTPYRLEVQGRKARHRPGELEDQIWAREREREREREEEPFEEVIRAERRQAGWCTCLPKDSNPEP
jgi:hypothetical protein